MNVYTKRKIKQKIKSACKSAGVAIIMTICLVVIHTIADNKTIVNVSAMSYVGIVTDVDSGGLRVRSYADTSTTDNIITKIYSGDKVDILDTVYNGDTKWYQIGFWVGDEYISGYSSADYISVSVIDDSGDSGNNTYDFEEYMNEQGFPESYKAGLRQLHQEYPDWVFVADHVNRNWEDIISNENVLGRSLVYGYAKDSWKSRAEGAYDSHTGEYTVFDSGGWVQASDGLVRYAIDPRNFLNRTNIFMFEDLAYSADIQNEQGVKNIIAGSFMENSSHQLYFDNMNFTYSSGLMYAGYVSGVSPYHLATRIIQEQGINGQGLSISGTVAGYEGLFNYYNQGAYKSGSISAIENGLIYASKNDASTYRAWNNRMNSIVGGAKIIGKNYINRGQNTLYYEKFDMITPYSHQYMTFILAPRQESVTASKAYSEQVKSSTALRFVIPIYNDMPYEACPLPDEYDIVGFTGLNYSEDGNWYYYSDGNIDYSYTGFAYNENGWWYVENGVVDFNYNGIAYGENNGWWYVENGKVDFDYTGIVYDENVGWWYIKDGRVAFDYTGIVYDENVGWWYIKDGRVAFECTGIIYSENVGWWYIEDGRVAFECTGIIYSENVGWWYIEDGRVAFECTGIIYDENVGWWYIEDGRVAFECTGIIYGENVGWWYIEDGRVAFECTGIIYDENVGWWYIKDGRVAFECTGIIYGENVGWWYIEDGRVAFEYTGMAYDENVGWWYIEDGRVAFEYTGTVSDENGEWYVVNGKYEWQ